MTAPEAAATEPADPAGGPFVHPALLYRGSEQYVDEVGGFARAALEAGEPVLVAVPGPRLEELRQGIGAAASEVVWADMAELGRNPGRILSALREFADRRPDRAARIVGEPVWPGRSRAEVLEATRHEALINTAFAGRRATVLCPYDTGGLPPEVIADARRTHPVVDEDGRRAVSGDYRDPREVCADCDRPLPEPGHVEVAADYRGGELAGVRGRVTAWAGTTALTPDRRADLVLAVNEATANSVAHGGGSGTLRLWRSGHGTVVAEVRDRGRLTDPLAGRRRPGLASAQGGRGLWMIHQLCDLVEVRAADDGLTLRLHVDEP
ncbi:anti-sigma factor RsbA family regulatory protein [Streptomyces desertarenae]|uniref:Anti-sigma factor RsbA family regulatory protein n=1 Tax=Streptomyces desertarenae TaxID=2666184 RepID=A0ABW4PQH3_9ACTN